MGKGICNRLPAPTITFSDGGHHNAYGVVSIVDDDGAYGADVCHAGGGARDLRNHLAGQRGPENFFEVDWIYRGITVAP